MDPMTMMAILGMVGKGVSSLAGGQQPQMKAPPPPQLMPIAPGMGQNLGSLLDPMDPTMMKSPYNPGY